MPRPSSARSLTTSWRVCCGPERERFERELQRLLGYRFKRLLIVGSESDILEGRYFSNINSKSVLATLYAFEVRYDVPMVFAPSPLAGARQIERWAFYFAREAVTAVYDLWRGKKHERFRLCFRKPAPGFHLCACSFANPFPGTLLWFPREASVRREAKGIRQETGRWCSVELQN